VSTRYRRWLVATLGMVLVAGVLVDDAMARRHLPIVSARIHGRRFKSRGVGARQAVVAGFAFDPTSSVLTFGASKVSGLHIGTLIRSMAVGCLMPGYNPATTIFPLTLACNGNYHEMRLGRPQLTMGWMTDTGIQVTLDSFDGTRAIGKFSGTYELPDPATPGTGTVAVERGQFNVVITVSTVATAEGAQ
jgi:hypothetical protein